MRVVCTTTPSPLLPLPLDSQTQLVTDLLNVLIGVASTTFPLNQSVQFDVRPGVCVSGASPESVSRLLGELAQYGTYYLRLSRFSLQSADKKGLVFQAFTGGLRKYLHYYRACVLSTPPTLSLLTIGFLFRKVGHQLRYLSELCCVDGPLGAGQATFPVVSVLLSGVKLLSYLYNEAQNNCSNENYPVLLSLLKRSCEPYTRFVSDWVYSGVFRDVYGEFMIQVNEEYLSFRDKHFWVQGYTLISKDVEDCVPIFLRHIANDVYVCGKTINLLKICCPQHYICWSELPVPRIAVTFSLQEVEEIEKDCAVYRGRMERIAKHSAVSREEQALRTEQARQELINQVRESAAKTLESIRGRQVSQRLAEEAKKRERFEELKQHLEQAQEWQSAAKRKQEEDDFSFARELRDREKRLQALEEQLEQRARKELIAQYSRLSEEAARRERRAMWRVQRMRLDEIREQFFMKDRQQIQVGDTFPHKNNTGDKTSHGSVASFYFSTNYTTTNTGTLPQLQTYFPHCILLLFWVCYSKVNTICHVKLQESPTQEPSEQQPEKTEQCDALSQTHDASSPTHISQTVDSPLISEYIDVNDFLPKSPNPDSQQVDVALHEIAAVQPELNKNHPSFSHIPIGENVFDIHESLPKSSPFGQVSKSSFLPGQYTLEETQIIPKASVYGHPSQATVQLVDGMLPVEGNDANGEHEVTTKPFESTGITNETNPDDHSTDAHHKAGPLPLLVSDVTVPQSSPSVRGHSSDTHINIGQNVSEVTGPLPTPNMHGHASDSHIKIGEHVSEINAPRPSTNVHGHTSNAHIKVGENVSDVAAPLPVANTHGHASDAHIKVGEHVSDVDAPLPSPSVHGHVSEAHIKLGENVSNIVSTLPAASVHGHSSDANIKVGEFVSNTPDVRPRWSKHGHASDCTLQPGCVVSGTEPALLPLPGSSYGHSSDSTLGIGCVVSTEEPKRAPLPGSAHGHSSDSNLGLGCVVSKAEPLPSPLPGSSYGHSSDSTLGVGCVVLGKEPQLSVIPGSAYGVSVLLFDFFVIHFTLKLIFSHYEQLKLLEGMGSWAAGFGLSPGEKSEQEYLSALSAQYQVEHYEDCYNIMASSPESQLLKHVTRGPWGLPIDPTLHRATDTTTVQLSEMVSLPVLIKHSVTTPLITHVSLVNKAVVDYFFVELGVERHFEALRHFLLMEDGEFAQSLSDLLFEKLGSGQTPGELLTPLVLNSILSKALQYSLHGDTPLASNFTFALRFLPETFHPHAPDSLNCLELRYKVEWPLNIIITDSCMNKYNRLFSFLLQLKHMVWSLRDVWFHLKRTALVKGAGRSVQFRQLQLYRHEMQHFVKVIQGYIANQILQVSWSEFTAKLAAANDLDAIHRTHADYLNRAIFRGLLTEKAAPVMNIIHSIFSLILKFRAQLIAQPWDNQQGEAVHPSFIAMQQSYNTFKYYSHFLFKVVTKLVNRGYQPHLEDFLLRINFNNYYKDS
uniref:Gamma-tubulin complex component 6 n=1 Tax=Sphaeramia orbicularis TaxID=375764 RepID=A0A672ZF40_9TELE